MDRGCGDPRSQRAVRWRWRCSAVQSLERSVKETVWKSDCVGERGESPHVRGRKHAAREGILLLSCCLLSSVAVREVADWRFESISHRSNFL